MTTILETQALIAKEITISLADKLRIPGPAVSSVESTNEFIRTEICKLYEEVFHTVKRVME